MLGYTNDASYFASEVERVKKNYNDLLLVKNEDNGIYVYRDLSRCNCPDAILMTMIDFRIEASNDGQNWTILREETDYPSPAPYGVQSFSFEKTDCRYLRIYATKLQAVDGREYRMQLSEVEVYNDSSLYSGPLTVAEIKDVDSLVTGKIYCTQPGDYAVYCAFYDCDSELLGVVSKDYSFDESGVVDFSAETVSGAVKVSVYGWQKDMVPVMDKISVAKPLVSVLTSSVGQNTAAFHSLRPRTNNTVYSFILTDNGSGDSGIMLGNSSELNSSSGNYFASGSIVLLFAGGVIYTRDASAKKQVAGYTVGTAVEIKIETDIAANTYALWVNGEKVAEGVSFRVPMTEINTLALVENGGGAAFNVSDFIVE